MQFLLCALGSAGDVHPVVGIGITLRSRGHAVSVVTNPHFETTVRAAGLDFVPIGTEDDYRAAIENPDLWHPRKGVRVTIEHGIVPSLQPLFDVVTSFDPAGTVVTGTLLCFGARIASEARDYRYATVHVQPAAIPSAYDPPRIGLPLPAWLPLGAKRAVLRAIYTGVIDPLLGDVVRFRERLGLARVANYFGSWVHSPDGSLALWPDWYAAPQPDWPARCEPVGFVGWDPGSDAPLPPDVDAFLAAGEPPVVFTAGSAALHSREFFETAVRAAVRAGRRALLVSQPGEQVPRELPSTIAHVTWVPFATVLPRAAALVHHGGIGTVAQALRAGLPQLIMPMAHDQPDNAARVERLGVGRTIGRAWFGPRRVARTIDSLVESGAVQAACRGIASRVDFDGARTRAAEWLERIAPA